MWSADSIGCGVLTYEECEKRANNKYKAYKLGGWKLAYATEIKMWGDAFVVEYHRQNILTFYRDGTVKVNTSGWSGNRSTHTRINELQGYVTLWNRSPHQRPSLSDTVRFCSRSDPEGQPYWRYAGFPWPGEILAGPGKVIEGLVDTVPIVDPAKREQRRIAAKMVRRAMGPRLMLGEFDNLLLEQKGQAFQYMRQPIWNGYGANHTNDTRELADLFLHKATHTKIAALLETEYTEPVERRSFGRPIRHYSWSRTDISAHLDRASALNAFINYVIRNSVLQGDIIDKRIEHPPVVL